MATSSPPPRRGLDRFQRTHGWLGFPLAVTYKFFEDQGNFLAAIITYYAFLSLFPLLLLLVTILGVVLHGHPHLQHQLVHSAISQFPIVGSQLGATRPLTGTTTKLVTGFVIAVYGGLGVVQAAQNAFNRAWAIPRQDRPDPLRSRLRSLGLLPILFVAVVITTGLTAFSSSVSSFIGVWGRVAGVVLSVLGNVAIFTAAFRILTGRELTIRQVAAGAVVASVGWELLQVLGTYFFARRLHGAGDVGGTFGVVLGLLGFLYVQAVVTVIAMEVNVVMVLRLWPRALGALFGDTRDLTAADMAAYTSYSRIERYKSFQDIRVVFHRSAGAEGDAGGAAAGDAGGAVRDAGGAAAGDAVEESARRR